MVKFTISKQAASTNYFEQKIIDNLIGVSRTKHEIKKELKWTGDNSCLTWDT